MKKNYLFPKNFLWGAATASFQIEGAFDEDGKSENIWDRFCKTKGNIKDHSDGTIACDHYHRIEEDVALMKKIGLQSYRFSISWCRILPNGTGEVNQKGIDFYNRLIDTLIANGIEPCVTLYHWDLPQVLQDQGGFTNRKIIDYFLEYVKVIFTHFGDRVKRFITFNEPFVFCILGYVVGEHAPGYRDISAGLLASHHVLVAHGKAVRLYREMGFKGEIGITLNVGQSYPEDPLSEEDVLANERNLDFVHGWYLNALYKGSYPQRLVDWYTKKGIVLPTILEGDFECIVEPTDFLGINYYSSKYVVYAPNEGHLDSKDVHHDEPVTELNWVITPEALKDILVHIQNTYQPKQLIITENGASFNDVVDLKGNVEDVRRIDYLKRHFIAMHEAIEEDVNLTGYYVWSLMDNFEWAEGYIPRFGLIYVDYQTLKRTIKSSGYWYSQVIQDNGFEI